VANGINIADVLQADRRVQSRMVAAFHAENPYGDNRVLIKTHDGKSMRVYLHGREFKFGPKGLRVPRGLGIELMQAFGNGGVYHLRDQRTFITRSSYLALTPQRKAIYPPLEEMNFLENYLIHVPDADDEDRAGIEEPAE
jgi:hypothetical protein